jgi:periplasmic copper chaperone A
VLTTLTRRVAPSAVALVLLVGCGAAGEPSLSVGEAQAAAPSGGSSQIVVDITNTGDGDDTLVDASTPAALAVEFHRTELVDDRASMGQLTEVDVPAGEQGRFRPGGLHLMVVVPDETVVVGGTFELTLRFERSGDVTVPVEVVDLLDLAESTFEDGD